ncbi:MULTISPECIES: YcjX family protein [Salinivibrio]|uniref:Nucleoside triphosphate hydrolase n=2 Tax=Salinivibrio costicola TaxID=51367 RepID=A0ABX3KP51_SALCS|nr:MULTISPECIES: YcjX family protein [Salinivibrio]OOF03097.1 nucleoside triphosphate hydrolase [Salinivibrio sp. MA607]OOF33486.1 nucleoside triphosphate hydrolase [Salinivibrio costicola subsp. alcaliphilus]
MPSVKRRVKQWASRGADRHVRLAVTGLSRAGKTAFITSLINQLTHLGTEPNLPLMQLVQQGRGLGARREPHPHMHLPAFDYDSAMQALHSTPPVWPSPTRDVSEVRLAVRYRPQSAALRAINDMATLYVDIIDYPGEWLLDLPLLSQTYSQWSAKQSGLLTGRRGELAGTWTTKAAALDPFAPADEKKLAEIAADYTAFLHQCKAHGGLHWVQPGRFVLPGELAGAPVVQFFPWVGSDNEQDLAKAGKDSNYGVLKARYDYYCEHVVAHFYREHFAKIDRQVILVDTLQPLNAGPAAFHDMRLAVEQLMQSFKYGKSGLLKRLFSPRIDKVLFAATKADHVTPEQHPNLVSLLQQIVHQAWQQAAFEGIDMRCQSVAAIEATTPGYVSVKGSTQSALKGHLADNSPVTLYPGEVPAQLPEDAFWQDQGFDFPSFRPQPAPLDAPLPHIRMDKALDYLLGDKFR